MQNEFPLVLAEKSFDKRACVYRVHVKQWFHAFVPGEFFLSVLLVEVTRAVGFLRAEGSAGVDFQRHQKRIIVMQFNDRIFKCFTQGMDWIDFLEICFVVQLNLRLDKDSSYDASPNL